MSIEFNRDSLKQFFQGNNDAVKLCIHLEYCGVLADDLITKRKERTEKDILNAYWLFLVDIPENPFYREHYSRLHPFIEKALLAWLHSIENNTFSVRDAIVNFFMECASIIGGPECIESLKEYLYGQTCIPERFCYQNNDQGELWV